ncbi:phosphotransferase enzyme family protein [Isoptericola sp. NPDC057391]|uniref:phosphotransferase enzyme family protein n=1 Tax=Isoptericola sp. NPDC057391 TaxID=3346117 RepID=UPI00362FC607
MNPDFLRARLPDLLAQVWDTEVRASWPVTDGMNSVTTGLDLPGGRYIAKWVPRAQASALARGARTAWELAERGVRSGRPLLRPDGALTAPAWGGELVVLEEVPGVPLTASAQDQRAWGRALGRVHALATRPARPSFASWLEDAARDVAPDDWVRRALDVVLREHERLPTLTWVQLHTDPAPEAFLRDKDGDVGVVDWTGSTPGPALYDVASALMYAGPTSGAALVEGYREESAVPAAELRHHLGAFSRFRAAVQAAYFARRVAERDLTGIASQDDNARGLADARGMLRLLGVPVEA